MVGDAGVTRLVRYGGRHEAARHGILTADGTAVREVLGDAFGSHTVSPRVEPLAGTELRAPVRPGKVVCVGLNHASTWDELGRPPADEPLFFLKGPNAVVGPGVPVRCPAGVDRLDVAGELAVVVGRRASRLSERDALDHVLGYTCANDVAVRDWMERDGQWFRAKGSDTFCPLGPWVVPLPDPHGLRVTVSVNGRVHQSGSTADLVWGVPRLLEFVTRHVTLEPGDVVLTGSPAGRAVAVPGDVVEVTVDRVGTLVNTVEAAVDGEEVAG